MWKSACLAITSSMALLAAAAQSAPVPNLVLACPDDSAIGQPGVDSCGGYTYQIPTNQRIVSTGSFSSNYWLTASDLGGSNTVLVCTLPVEPGTYSSCRDALGVRRTAYVPKDSVLAGGVVTVSKTGGDYADPITAAENAFAGDTWCVAPAWPLQPCVMEIGKGVFILPETLAIPEGLAVVGAGKGDTLLVADIGVVTAVSSRGNARISDLTIVNSQPGGARAAGLGASPACPGLPTCESVAGLALQVHDVAIHVSGVAETAGVLHGQLWLDVLDSEITAVGPDSKGIYSVTGQLKNDLTFERSHLSADTALSVFGVSAKKITARFIDSHISGTVLFDPEDSLLEIVRSSIVGDVEAFNDFVRLVITGSSIKGNVDGGRVGLGGPAATQVLISDTSIEGNLGVKAFDGALDGVDIRGSLTHGVASVRRSHIINPVGAAIQLGNDPGRPTIKLEQTFIQGAPAIQGGFHVALHLEASSSVLAGPISLTHPEEAVLSCTDTYGADYELLSAACQPQAP